MHLKSSLKNTLQCEALKTQEPNPEESSEPAGAEAH